MSYTTILAVMPDVRPVELAELPNAWGWAPSIWGRLLGERWLFDDAGLNLLWRDIETLPGWKQVAVPLDEMYLLGRHRAAVTA